MSDARFRELVRRARGSRSPLDEADFLVEACRLSHVERRDVELAAYCGAPGARSATGPEPVSPTDPLEWFDGLGQFSRSNVVAAAVSVAESSVSRWRPPVAPDPRVLAPLVAAKGWLLGTVLVDEVEQTTSRFEADMRRPSLLAAAHATFTQEASDAVRAILACGKVTLAATDSQAAIYLGTAVSSMLCVAAADLRATVAAHLTERALARARSILTSSET